MGMKYKDLETLIYETRVEETKFEVELPNEEKDDVDDETSASDTSGTQPMVDPDYLWARERERRTIMTPRRYGYADLVSYVISAAEEVQDLEPRNFKEAFESKESKYWLKAANQEMDSFVKLPKNQMVVGCKCIFKKKEGISGVEGPRYKARLVAKGFTQVEGIDYNEIFSPVVKHCSIRILMAIVNQFNLELEQMDVNTAFLHGDLEETIYMEQPKVFVEDKSKVCLLKKSLYGLKQSPMQWYRRFDEFLLKTEFVRSRYDSCVYMLKKGEELILYLLLY
jgi:hypothetical protein